MKYSQNVEKHITVCRKIAERYNNKYISMRHFLLAFSHFRTSEKDFKISFGTKKNIIKNLIIDKVNLPHNLELIPITKDFERALGNGSFHSWILGYRFIEPMHIILSIIGSKSTYHNLLNENGIKINLFKKIVLDIYFVFKRHI